MGQVIEIGDYIDPQTIQLWEHHCPVEGEVISTEQGHECNWCGERE